MSETKIVSTIAGLDKSMNTLSGALYTNIEILKSPVEDLVTAFNNFSNSSNNLQKKLIFWTKIMAGAIIIQALAIGVQIYLSFLR
jgi:hypothetical protein